MFRTFGLVCRSSPRNGRILLANSGQATNRANRDVRVAARGTPLSQAEARLKLIATAVATCCRCAFASPRNLDRRSPNDRTPSEPEVGVALGEGGAGDTGGQLGDGRDGARLQGHGGTSGARQNDVIPFKISVSMP